METAKKRLQFVDMAKGIAAICIVFYHILAPTAFSSVVTGITSGALFLFFVLSGYFYTPGKRSLKANIAGKAKALLIPFFGYSLSFWAVGTIYYLIVGTVPFIETLYCLRNFYVGCIWNRTIQDWFSLEYYSLGKRYIFLADFWFLLALLFAYILFLIIADKVLRSKVKESVAIVVLLTVTGVLRSFQIFLPYNLQLVPFWTALLLFGAIMKERDLYNLPFMKGIKAWFISIGSVAIGVTVLTITGFGTNVFRGTFDWIEPITMVILFVCSILVVWGFGSFCKLWEETGARINEIAWLGSHSLYIYLFHMFYAWLISTITGFSILYKDEITAQTVVISVLIALASLALSILTGIIADIISGKVRKRTKK